jgi:hypothetical protein
VSTAGIAFLIKEMADRGISVRAKFPDYKHILVSSSGDPWQEVAGSMQKAIQEMDWVFRWGVIGKHNGQDYLSCNSCEEVMMLPKAKGAPSQKPVCHSTPGCKGIYRRLPEIFEVDKPPVPWRGVTWDFDDGGTVVIPAIAKNGCSCTLEPVAEGTSLVSVSFRTKEGVSYLGTNVITVKDGKFSRCPWSWTITPALPEATQAA